MSSTRRNLLCRSAVISSFLGRCYCLRALFLLPYFPSMSSCCRSMASMHGSGSSLKAAVSPYLSASFIFLSFIKGLSKNAKICSLDKRRGKCWAQNRESTLFTRRKHYDLTIIFVRVFCWNFWQKRQFLSF